MSTVAVELNGTETTVASGTTVEGLVLETSSMNATTRSRRGRGIAVAVNGEVVPRSEWATTELGAGDRVEILNAVGGG